eukprot:8204661-Alexandrium_andersonii.AAC.1
MSSAHTGLRAQHTRTSTRVPSKGTQRRRAGNQVRHGPDGERRHKAAMPSTRPEQHAPQPRKRQRIDQCRATTKRAATM